MIAKLYRNVKAGFFLAALVAAKVPSWGNFLPSTSWGSQGKPAVVSTGQVGVEMRKIQQDVHANTGSIGASSANSVAALRATDGKSMKVDPYFQNEANRIMEQIEAILVDPNLQEEAKRFPEQAVDAQLEDQAKRIVEQMDLMMASPSFQKRAERIAKRIDVMIADRNFQEQAKLVGEQIRMLSTCPACPAFHKHAKHIIEQVLMMMAHPALQERARHVVEQMDNLDAARDVRDTLVDSLADGLFEKAHKAPSLRYDGFDGVSSRSRRRSLQVFHERPMSFSRRHFMTNPRISVPVQMQKAANAHGLTSERRSRSKP